MDYIFLAAQQGVNIFTVAIGEILQINHGVTIWLDQNVELQVSGRMVNTGVGEGQIVFSRRIVEGSERGAWRAIHLIGDGDFNDADGIINLDECLIEGGGAGDDPDNDGLIVLSGDRPELTIGEPILMPVSELRYSESNGIVSITGAIQWRGRIILINAYMNDEERSIARVGVKMGDSDINNYIWDTTLLRIDHCTITDCGSHGIAVYHFQGGDYQIIDTSKVNFNGQDQELGFGAGILFENPDQIYFQNGSILVEDSQINNNTRDGIRLWQCNAAVSILKSEIQYNDGCGILDNLEGDCWPTYFDKNYIAYNGLSGVHAYKAGAWYEAAVLIRGNRFVSNGTAVNEVEVANIRIRGTISRTMFGQPGWVMSEINNNIISGGNTGISIGRVQFVGEFRVPDCIHIQNNIQSSAGIQGLHIDDIGFGENPNPAMVFPTEISNNIFYGNGFEAEENDGSGIWIGEDSRSFMGHEEVIRNNLLIANTDFGIQYIPIELGSPEFDFNGFDDNGANTFGCDLGVNTIVADPRFVDADGGDFHLLWNSPMINRGDDDPDFNDANYPSAEQIPRDGSRNDIGAYGGPGAADYGFDPYCAIDAAHNVVTNANLPDDPDNGGRDWLEWDYYKVFGDITTPNGEVFDIGNPDFEERDEDEIGRAWFEFVADAGWSVNGAGD
ncbi:MAG: right-handed parallel beta-helix repeat-containing protein, partial [Calditrichaeota bacterium]|nr:right-handed parallel beta-helix repeat-containing protein [Calditrichota bacterium]